MKFLSKRRLAGNLHLIARELGKPGAYDTYTYQQDHFKIVLDQSRVSDEVSVYISTVQALSARYVCRGLLSLHPNPRYWKVSTFRPGLWVDRIPVLLAEVHRRQKIRFYQKCAEQRLSNAPINDLDMERDAHAIKI